MHPQFSAALLAIAALSCSGLITAATTFTNATPSLSPPSEFTPIHWAKVLQSSEKTIEYVKDNQAQGFAGGVAARDLNGDHRIDLILVEQGHTAVYLQNEAGHYERIRHLEGGNNQVLAADFNQDGQLDIMVGEVRYVDANEQEGSAPRYRIWLGPHWSSLAEDCQPVSLAAKGRNIYSHTMGDANGDGLLDIFSTHWTRKNLIEEPHLWFSEGGCTYSPATPEHGILGNFAGQDFSFTPTFSDLTNNGWPDLLVASDFETSQYFINGGNGHFENRTNPFVIDDQNGMGSAVADFNNDGLFDWFVTAVWDADHGEEVFQELYGTWGGLGNRLYINRGDGTFANTSTGSGISHGHWGWGACAADFNNDGQVDLYHVNGFMEDEIKIHPRIDGQFSSKPSRLFINQGDATFLEEAAAWGVDEPNEGRSVACFDHGRDGDIDFIYTQAYGEARLFINRLNDSPDTHVNYFGVILEGMKGNLAAAGAKVYLFPENGQDQVREIRIGGNFLGQHPPEAHFGLGDSNSIKRVLIQWPGHPARYTSIDDPGINQWIAVKHPDLEGSHSHRVVAPQSLTEPAKPTQ